MKKKLLTLAVCVAVTSISAYGATVATKSATPVKSSGTEVKKVVNKTPEAKPTPEQMKKEFEARMAKDRAALYEKLKLTEEQIKKSEELHKKNHAAGEPLIDNLRLQKAKLYELKAQKATEEQIEKQKAEVKAARKKFKAHMTAANKEFEAVLTKEQLAVLKKIKAEKKEQMKTFKKSHCKKGCPMHGGFSPKEDFLGPKPPIGPQGSCPPPPEAGTAMPKCPCGK